MNYLLCTLFLVVGLGSTNAQSTTGNRTKSFDADWRFVKDSLSGPENVDFNDAAWRTVETPHDWSIEDLPNQTEGSIVGPFSKATGGKMDNGYMVGGTGWYRKRFTQSAADQGKTTYVQFDGVSMNSDVWLNGHYLGNHPYGYTSFYYDLTPHLKPIGQENVLAVRVRNPGRNNRWYSGAGIYRHVWLTTAEAVHIDVWGTAITTPQVTPQSATVQVVTTVKNTGKQPATVTLQTELRNTTGVVVSRSKSTVSVMAGSTKDEKQTLTVASPALWSVDRPTLYQATVRVLNASKPIDAVTTAFGIRTIHFDAKTGFTLNGKSMKLKGGNIHQDNGPLGTAAIDRAEERKVELIKKAGYNALRMSHNPPSPALLATCDRLGMLVIDETYDIWEKEKRPLDYHLYFKDWWKKDLQSMILRDRNHPAIILWSIGNEIPELADTSGYRIARQLADETRRLDPTRPVTEALVMFTAFTPNKTWDDTAPHYAQLDVGGYNYALLGANSPIPVLPIDRNRYERDHQKYPDRIMYSSEFMPPLALENWKAAEKYPYFIGNFSWTAMDYLGESGIGIPRLVPDTTNLRGPAAMMVLFNPETWPYFNAYCGDLDLIGTPKPASLYQNVVWRNSPVELLVHRPIPAGKKELVSLWGFPDVLKSWSWPGQESKTMQVYVYARSPLVKLELNGKIIAEQTIPDSSITAVFTIPYQPGTLVARAYTNGKETGTSVLTTAGKPAAIRLKADRSTIRADRTDLSYVTAEVVDATGNLIPYADEVLIQYDLSGKGQLVGVANGNPGDVSSFKQPRKKAWQGRGLAIVRPTGGAGTITLKASAEGLQPATLTITTR